MEKSFERNVENIGLYLWSETEISGISDIGLDDELLDFSKKKKKKKKAAFDMTEIDSALPVCTSFPVNKSIKDLKFVIWHDQRSDHFMCTR